MSAEDDRRRLAGDPYRPVYHFAAPANFTGDPNGTIFWDGVYHLFYQHNPDGAYDNPRRMHWGHAVSRDLIHWQDLPIALAPEPGEPDRLGCYSGGAIDLEGVPALVYFGSPDGICVATSRDGLRTWSRHRSNPLIPQSTDPEAEWRAWDPFVWRDGDAWYLVCGGKIDGAGDTAFLFRSHDFVDWEYRGPLYAPGNESDCSVPDLFRLGDAHVLLFASHERGVQYYVGELAGERFTPRRHGRMNFAGFSLESGTLCASITLCDGAGRRIMFGWVTEGRTEAAQRASGWSGVMCLPRVLSLGCDGGLCIDPVPELHVLRGAHQRFEGLPVPAGATVELPGVDAACAELAVTFERESAGEIGVMVGRSPDGAEQTRIAYSRSADRITLDPAASSAHPDVVGRAMQHAPLVLDQDEALQLRIFIDRSIVEVFANGRQCLTQRVYPSRPDSCGVAFTADGNASVRSVDVWQMRSIWS